MTIIDGAVATVGRRRRLGTNVISGNEHLGRVTSPARGSKATLGDNLIGLNARRHAGVPNAYGVEIAERLVRQPGRHAGRAADGHLRQPARGRLIHGAGTRGNLVQDALHRRAGRRHRRGPERAAGVAITDGARSNTIGGGDSGVRNVISGNPGAESKSWGRRDRNVVRGNSSAGQADGLARVRRRRRRHISDGARNNTIGGALNAPAEHDLREHGSGRRVPGTGTRGNRMRGNLIGLAPNSTTRPNGISVDVADGARNTGDRRVAATPANWISTNAGDGVLIEGAAEARRTDINRNRIFTQQPASGSTCARPARGAGLADRPTTASDGDSGPNEPAELPADHPAPRSRRGRRSRAR